MTRSPYLAMEAALEPVWTPLAESVHWNELNNISEPYSRDNWAASTDPAGRVLASEMVMPMSSVSALRA